MDSLFIDEEGIAPRPPKTSSKRGRPQSSCMVDITALLGMPQQQAAEVLGISESMLCKRYRECANRKWPFRKVAKLDKEIAALLQAVPQTGLDAGVLPEEVETQLTAMLKERAVDLRKISIRL